MNIKFLLAVRSSFAHSPNPSKTHWCLETLTEEPRKHFPDLKGTARASQQSVDGCPRGADGVTTV